MVMQRGRPPKLSPADTYVIIHNPEGLLARDLAERFKVSITYIYQVRARWKKQMKSLAQNREPCDIEEPAAAVLSV